MDLIKVRINSGITGWVVYSIGCKLSQLGVGDFVRITKKVGSDVLYTGRINKVLMRVSVKIKATNKGLSFASNMDNECDKSG